MLLLLINLEKGEKNKLYIEADFRLLISPEIALTNVAMICLQHTTVNLIKIYKGIHILFLKFLYPEKFYYLFHLFHY